MKKLITLLLVLTGMVGTASAKTFYVKDNCNWGAIYLYAYTGDSKNAEWPGVKIDPTVYVDWDGYYLMDIGEYSNFVIHNGKQSDKNVETNCNERTVKTPGDVEEGGFYEFVWSNNNGDYEGHYVKFYNLSENTIYSYNFHITTTEAWSTFKVHLWEYGTSNNKTTWPGNNATDLGSNNYSYTFKSYMSKLGVVFNQKTSSEDSKPKTCDLSALPGDNNYYIYGADNDGNGEFVKTNASGYATFTNTNALTIPSGIAYVAVDNGNGSATAHNITNPVASTPMLIKGNASTTYHFATGAGSDHGYTNAFHAGTSTTESGGLASNPSDGVYNFILNGDTFKAANGKKVAVGKAYLQLSAAPTADSPVLLFTDIFTTDISNAAPLKNNEEITNNKVFNLAGQRVATLTKGLYIVNGRKVVLK